MLLDGADPQANDAVVASMEDSLLFAGSSVWSVDGRVAIEVVHLQADGAVERWWKM